MPVPALLHADHTDMLRSGTNSRMSPMVPMRTLHFDKVPMATIGDDVMTTKSFRYRKTKCVWTSWKPFEILYISTISGFEELLYVASHLSLALKRQHEQAACFYAGQRR